MNDDDDDVGMNLRRNAVVKDENAAIIAQVIVDIWINFITEWLTVY